MAGKALDDNDVRIILAVIVRRWTTTVEVVYLSDAARKKGARVHIEHVVPVRLLVDRMIQYPRTSKSLLRACVVVAKNTPEEHARTGSLVGANASLYEKMRTKGCLIDEIVEVAWKRYSDHGVVVTDANGRKPRRGRGPRA
jgi:hypothetical protein